MIFTGKRFSQLILNRIKECQFPAPPQKKHNNNKNTPKQNKKQVNRPILIIQIIKIKKNNLISKYIFQIN